MKRAAGTCIGAILAWAVVCPTLVAQTPASEPVCATAFTERGSGDVTLRDFAWLAGSWRGPGPNGSTAEIHYMEPVAGVLPSVFRLWKDGRQIVTELITLVENEGGITLHVRHFTPTLVPLEKGQALTLRLVGRHGDCFGFENVRDQNPRRSFLQRTGIDSFLSWSELLREDGTIDEIRVEYRRVGQKSQ